MTRKRDLLPEMFRNEDLLALSVQTRLTAIGLRLYADDHGRETATAALIKAALWPLDTDVTDATINGHLIELDDAGYLDLYQIGPRTYFQVVEWPRVDHPAVSKIPEAPARDSSRTAREPFAAGEGEREEKESERYSEGEGAWRDAEGAESAEGGYSRTVREDLPPSPFCRSHPEGTDKPCRNCGTARLRHRSWNDQQLAGVRPTFADSGPD
ncbi:hypothetical protein QN354_09470 [Cryobacterium sp. 5I3]|uniref:hypothetical protein n=1 Tax=Cryobacterium sp. 5I3 TaxID=3048592 RepID=UPI002B23492A|nr:hypothetical protein [Cryobacterium sp. 5I3]MEB0201984.1 hypothetical protein [Cryobacterium sp. 5I3]